MRAASSAANGPGGNGRGGDGGGARAGAEPGASSKSNSPGCGLFVTDVVLAAHGREAAEIAGEQVVRRDRERAGLDRVGDRDRLGASLREHGGTRLGREHGGEQVVAPAERQVAGLGGGPRASEVAVQVRL